MARVLGVALLAGLFVAPLACGKGSGESGEKKKATAPSEETSTAPASEQDAPNVPAAPAKPEAKAAAESWKPLAHQLGPSMTEFRFLGWTADGKRFALETMHGEYAGAERSEEPADPDLLVMRMRVVYEAEHGKAIASFRISNKLPDDQRAKFAAAWSEAQPAEAWKAWLVDNPLVAPAASAHSPDGAASIRVALERGPAADKADLTPKERRGGFYYRWEPWKEGCGGEDCPDEPLPPELGGPAVEDETPRWSVRLKRGAEERSLLTYDSPMSWEQKGADPGSFYTGNLRAFWAPAGDRVLVATFQKLNGSPEASVSREASFFVRDVAPKRRE